jgi:cell division protein ZipA
MDLRVSLLIIGGLIILAIYLFSRRSLSAEERRVSSRRTMHWSALWQALRSRLQPKSEFAQEESYTPTAPVLDPDELDQLEEIIPERGVTAIKSEEMPMIVELGSEQIAPAGEQLFIPLTLMGKAGQVFSGEAIRAATNSAGMVLKDDGIYRFEVKDTQGYLQPLLGLANILEPGTFSSEQLAQFTTPGLVLYLHLPAPIEAREAFDKLIELGHKLEDLLEAELCDETRSVLTNQTIGHLKEKVEAFRFKQKMTSLQRRRP